MTLQIGDTAPNFEVGTTEGVVRFHDWIGDKWVVLFSHPKVRPRSNIRRAGRRPSPISASCRSRRAERTGWSEVSMRVCRKVRSSAIRTNYKVQYGGTRL